MSNPFQSTKPSGIVATKVSIVDAKDHELNITPYPHQVAMKEELVKAVKKGKRRNVVYLSTGAGKTAVGAMLISNAIKAGKKVLFTAPYLTLIDQTVEKMQEYGIPMQEIGVIQGNHPRTNPDALLQVASVQTLIRRDLSLMLTFDLIIVDECHLNFNKFYEALPEKTLVMGLTATPFSPALRNNFDNLVKTISMYDLMQEGKLSGIRVISKGAADVSGISKISNYLGRDFNQRQLSERMQELPASYVEGYKARELRTHTLVFAVDVEHAHQVQAKFTEGGVEAEVITGDTPLNIRAGIFARYQRGITEVIVSVNTISAGFDSAVNLIISLRPTMSVTLYLQQTGRGLRTAEGKVFLELWDYSGNTARFGLPQSITIDHLPESEDEVPLGKIHECPECGYLSPVHFYVTKCPVCGYSEEDPEVLRANREKEYQDRRLRYKLAELLENEKKRVWRGSVGVGGNYNIYNTESSLLHQVTSDVFTDDDGFSEFQYKKLIMSPDHTKILYRCRQEKKQHYYDMLQSYYKHMTNNEGKDWSYNWIAAKYKECFDEYPDNEVIRNTEVETLYPVYFIDFLTGSTKNWLQKSNETNTQDLDLEGLLEELKNQSP
jgi:DNA repair protein RadD